MKNTDCLIPRPCRTIVALSLGLALSLVLILTLVRPAQAAGVIYVDADAVGPTHDGLSWATAYTNVQDALAAAVSGDEIWVAEGVYYPDQGAGQTEDARTSTFALKPGVALYGGFAGTETARDQRDWAAHVTVLSGDIDQNDTVDPHGVVTTTAAITGSNAYHVVSSSNVTETARLDGFTLTAGQANGGSYPHYHGGGMYNVSSSPMLTNVTLSGNMATNSGGGMYNYQSSPKLTNITVSGNTAQYGGGMYNSSSSPTLINVTLSGNQADWYGGGMYNDYSSPKLIDVTLSGNQADWYGGGMYNSSSSPALTDATVSGNTAQYGGGMYNYQSSSILTDVTVSGNRADHGGGMYSYQSSSTLNNVTLSGNQADYGGGMHNSYSSNPTLINVTLSDNNATDGGGIYNVSSNPTLMNVTFSGNWAAAYGGGMCNDSSSPKLINVTLSGNQAGWYGGGMSNAGSTGSNPTLVNCILWGNSAPAGAQIYNGGTSTPTVTYSDVQGGYAGTGNLNADPWFVDAAGDDLHLRPDSPAIDAGNNLSVTVTTDLDGNPRFVDVPSVPDTGNGTAPVVDMGAYEACVNVALVKAVSPSAALPGETITFTLAFANGGSITATHVVITDPVPAFLSVTSVASYGIAITDTGYAQPYVWAVQDLPPGADGAITLTGRLAVPLADGVYTNTATIRADEDAWAANNTGSASILVNVNDPPAFTSTPVTTATQDAVYTYAIAADDPDLLWGDSLTLTAPTLPAWLTLTDHGNGTATLSGTPARADVGDQAVVLRVTDGGGLYATQAFTLTVKPWYWVYLPLVLKNAPF